MRIEDPSLVFVDHFVSKVIQFIIVAAEATEKERRTLCNSIRMDHGMKNEVPDLMGERIAEEVFW